MLEIIETQGNTRPWPTTSYDRRSFNSKPRLYINVKGENIMENLLFRSNRPSKLYKSLLPEIFERLGISPNTKAVWSQKAGCSCGCSPGFILTDTGVTSAQMDYWATIKCTEDPQAAKVVDTDDAKALALQRFQELSAQGIVEALTPSSPSITLGTGRGDAGNLRNFRQMSDKKFFGVLSDVLTEGDDVEAITAVKAEAARRGES